MLVALCAVPAAKAQTVNEYEERLPQIQAGRAVGRLGPGLFGDKVGYYTGSLEFVQSDVAIPGNSALPVAAARRLTTGSTRVSLGHFGDWDIELPHLFGVFAASTGWVIDASQVYQGNALKRCSQFSAPPDVVGQGGSGQFMSTEYWAGNHLYVPGQGQQEMLQRSAANTAAPSDGNAYPVVSAGGWQFRCLSAMAPGNGSAGEAFMALAPDGTEYRFDWMVSRLATSLRGGAAGGALARGAVGAVGAEVRDTRPARATDPGNTPDIGAGGATLLRNQVLIYPTQIRDRFGNTVTLEWDTTNRWQLRRVLSSDGRQLSFSYNTGNPVLVSSVSDGSRTWSYSYSGTGAGAVLASVTQPDNAQWQFSGSSLQANVSYLTAPQTCSDAGVLGGADLTKTMVHPSGAVGTFTLRPTLHARSFLPACNAPTAAPIVYYGARSLVSKTISGPGVPASTWTVSYSAASGGTQPCAGCSGTKVVTLQDPRGVVTRHTYGTRWTVDEGQLLMLEEGVGSATPRTTAYRYRSPTAGPYPDPIGVSPQASPRGDGYIATRHNPQDRRAISWQGSSFTWEATAYDSFGQPTAISRMGPGGSRTETTTYAHNFALWVLGQVATVTAGTGQVMQSNEYFPSTAQLKSRREFGVLKASYTYNTDGTLASRADGASQSTTFGNYKRGVPQTVGYPTGAGESVVVDDLGRITSHTSAGTAAQPGYTSSFGYDAMGRLTSLTPPAGFAATTATFTPVNTAEYGLPAGHWRHTATRGGAITATYFDALWRPVMTRTFDSGNEANTRKVSLSQFDIDGRPVYESYTARDIATVSATPAGTRTTYDAHGRVTQVQADSELGTLTTATDYLTGFQTRITNARGKATTQSLWALDDPGKATLAGMTAPAGVNVAISRDSFGKPTAITRSGSFNGYTSNVTRRYVYEPGQRLCKTVEPEVGATVQAYDAAGNVSWRAPGQNLPDTTAGGLQRSQRRRSCADQLWL